MTRTLFEEAGFDCIRPLGSQRCVMRRIVEPARSVA
jgi:hypothetical protein